MEKLVWFLFRSLVVFLFRATVALVKLGLLLGLGINLDEDKEKDVTIASVEDEGENLLEATELRLRFEAIAETAKEMRAGITWDRANESLKTVLDDFLVPQATRWAKRLKDDGAFYDLAADDRVLEFEVILAEINVLVQQRKSSSLRHDLGDADALAMACYRPLAEFARAHSVKLTSITPMVQLTEFELATWTAFVPTGVAPIFLPSDFFQRLAWWPALAHEIGHDFLAATSDVDWQLRLQLDIPSENKGREFLQVDEDGLSYGEITRVFGGWLEEMFCDLIATMMLGPAYGWTMVELFAGTTEEVTTAPVDGYRFAMHPPRHLRLLNCAHILRYMEQAPAADDILEAWGHKDAETLSYRTQYGEDVGLPIELVSQLSEELVTKLYVTQLDALAGHSLESLPGVDYGPHAAAETLRARDAFLAGESPSTRHPHRIIGGAILAWRAQPSREVEFLRICRTAIVGKAEWADSKIATEHQSVASTRGSSSPRDAFILSTILSPPPGLRNRQGGHRGSFGERPRR